MALARSRPRNGFFFLTALLFLSPLVQSGWAYADANRHVRVNSLEGVGIDISFVRSRVRDNSQPVRDMATGVVFQLAFPKLTRPQCGAKHIRIALSNYASPQWNIDPVTYTADLHEVAASVGGDACLFQGFLGEPLVLRSVEGNRETVYTQLFKVAVSTSADFEYPDYLRSTCDLSTPTWFWTSLNHARPEGLRPADYPQTCDVF